MTYADDTATQRQIEIFFTELAATDHVQKAVAKSGLPSRTVYSWRDNDVDFARRWTEARERYVDNIEAEAYRRAVEGLDEPLSHQGQLSYVYKRGADGKILKDEETGFFVPEVDEHGRPRVVTVKKYSDSLLALMLKAKRKREYGDSSKVELSGADGGPVKIEESPTAIGRKIAFALATAMRAKEQEATVEPDDGSDMA